MIYRKHDESALNIRMMKHEASTSYDQKILTLYENFQKWTKSQRKFKLCDQTFHAYYHMRIIIINGNHHWNELDQHLWSLVAGEQQYSKCENRADH